MAFKEITDLDEVLTMNGTDYLHVKQGAADVRVTPDTLFALHIADSNPHSITKTTVALGNVTNDAQLKIASNLADLASAATARTNLDVQSTAQVTAAISAHSSLTNNPHSVTATQVGLSNLFNYGISHDPDVNSTTTYASIAAVNVVREQADTLADNLVPVGAILMWATSAAIPAGWAICNGLNGTVDLRGRFIRGGELTAGPYQVGTVGGSDTVSHTHSGSTGGFALTAEHIPAHRHNCPVGFFDSQYGYSGGSGGRAQYNDPEDDTGYHARTSTSDGSEFGLEGQAHSHSATIDTTTHSNLPSYFTVIFIQKL